MFLSFLEWDKEIISDIGERDIIRGYDEPDTSLHYEAQRRLFYNILDVIKAENSRLQAMICTHSLIMIDRANPKDIFYLKLNDDAITEIEYLITYNDEDIESYLTELSIEMGLPNSSIFFERCFIIIEGHTEFHCLPKLYFKKYDKRFIEDGIKLINIEGVGNAKGFIKLLGKNKEHSLLFLLDNDCNNPDSICSLTPRELIELGFRQEFVENQVIYIGAKEFEDSFKNKTFLDCLNTNWSKKDGNLWTESDIVHLRQLENFSKELTKFVNRQSRKKKIDSCTKPRLGDKIGDICEIEDFPSEILEIFEKARLISRV